MTSNVNKLNTLVSTFFEDNSDSKDMNEAWMDPEFQKKLKSLFAGAVRASQKKRDPNAPKRGKSAYLFFCTARRDAVKKELGNDAKATEITARLGKLWKQLKENPKKKNELAEYEKLAAEDKSRYLKDKESYVPPEDCGSAKGARRRKEPRTGPKRAKSAYLFFCDETRVEIKKENPNMSAIDVTSELGRRWNLLKKQGDKATKKYNDLAAKDKARYESEKDSAKSAKPKAASAKGKAAAKAKVETEETEETEEGDEDIIEDEPTVVQAAKPKAASAKGKAGAKNKKK